MYENIRQEMRASNLTAEGMAEMLGVTALRLERWVSGQEGIPARKLLEIMRLLGAGSADYLLDRG